MNAPIPEKDGRRYHRKREHFKNKTEIKAGLSGSADPRSGDGAPARPYGCAILQAGLYDQLRSSPTTHHSIPQLAPIIPVSSEIE